MAPNRALAIQWFEEVWNQGREELIPELALPDAISHDLEGPGVTTKGLDAFSVFYRQLRGAIPDLNVSILETIAESDKVVLRIRSRGTHLGDQLGIPPTGNPLDLSSVIIIRYQDGKIAEAWNYLDQLAFYQQLRILNVR